MLTLIGYLQSGGVHGAVAKTAETVYRDALTPEQQGIARNIFLRLTELGEGTEDTRRRVSLAEVVPRDGATVVEEVLRLLSDARHVTLGEDTVEVAHEALIRHWPTLRAWLDEDREGRLVHRRLTEAALEWETLEGDPGTLYRGTRLAGAADWAAAHDSELNELEREFVAASREAELGEIEATRRRNRRLRILVAALAVVLLGALAAGAVALVQRQNARDAATTAIAQRLGAQALVQKDLDRSLLLARQGVELDDTLVTHGNLLSALVRSPAAIGSLRPLSGRLLQVEVTGDGRTIGVRNNDGEVALLDARTRRTVRTYRGFTGFFFFTRDGKSIVRYDFSGGSVVGGDIATGKTRATIPLGPDVPVLSVARDLTRFTAAMPDGRVGLVRDLRTRRLVTRVRATTNRRFIDFFMPSGRYVLGIEAPGDPETSRHFYFRLWDLSTGRIVGSATTQGGFPPYALSDDRSIGSAGDDKQVLIWDVAPERWWRP